MEIDQDTPQGYVRPDMDSFSDPYREYQQQEDTASIIKQIDPAKILKGMEYRLQGYMIDERGNVDKKKKERPLLNDEGVNKIMNIAASYLSLNTSLSINTDKEISNIMRQLNFDMTKILMLSRKEFMIKLSTDRDQIKQIVVPPIYFVLKRSLDIGQNDKKFLKGQSQESIVRHYQDKEKQGFFNKLNPLK